MEISAVFLKVIVGIGVLGILIFVHELGHFLFAKYFKVGVLEFAIGFGQKLWSKQVGETRYSIRLIRLGGYVRMVGDDPRMYNSETLEESSPGFEMQAIDDLDEVQKAVMHDRSRWLLEKSYWPKFLIIFGGPLFNLLFAWFAATGFYAYYGDTVFLEEARLGQLFPDYPAEKAGLKKGDLVTAVNGTAVDSWKDFAAAVKDSDGNPINLAIKRGQDESLSVTVSPQIQAQEEALLGGNEEPAYVIGVIPSSKNVPIGFGKALLSGAQHTVAVGVVTIKSIYWMLSGKVSAEHISGPISIVDTVGTAAQSGMETFIGLLIFLSVNLAILNLLPIPVLDGGHILFMTIAALLRRPLDTRIQDYATVMGMVLLLSLMLFAVGNDLWRLTN